MLVLLLIACWLQCDALELEILAQEEVIATSVPQTQQRQDQQSRRRFPAEINLRAAVLHAPPFATVEERADGTVEYGGLQPDLLQRLQVFAADDNVTLTFNLSVAPPQYGPAFDLVADDCHEVVENPEENCGKLDMIVGNYYATPDRALRVDLSPAWLRSTISTIKYTHKTRLTDFTTLSQAEMAKVPVCLKDGTFYAGVVQEKFPNIPYEMCEGQDDCLDKLKKEMCVLYASDELQLRHRAAWDNTLEVTREQFNTQYIVWPTSYDLDPIVHILLHRWVLAAVTNATLDELYATYFQKANCPVGTAGENCELPCDPDHGQSDAVGVCVCQSTKWSGDDCSIEVEENTNLIAPSLLGMAYAMLGINISAIVGCAIWLIWNRHATQVKVSQPFFLQLVLLGCMISSCTIIPLAQQDEGDGTVRACLAVPWLYSVGFSITFGTLFAKIRRVYKIFKSAIDMRRSIVTVKETFCVISVVLAIDVTILMIWSVVDPLEWQRDIIAADQFGEPLESVGYCTSDHWMAFAGCIAALHLLLMGVACYMCYVARNIPTKFSEGKYVSIAMISNLQIFVVGVPILIMLGTDSQTGFFVRCVIIWMNDLAVVALIFGNLIYSVHWAPESAANKDMKSVVSNAVKQYSRANSGLNSGVSSRMMSSSRMDSSNRIDKSGELDGRRGSGDMILPFSVPLDGSDHNAKPLPMKRKASFENLRVTFKETNIPPMIGEEVSNASTGQTTAKKPDLDGVFIDDTNSVGDMNVGYDLSSDGSRHGDIERDVLANNKESWGGICLSTVLNDSSSCSSRTSFLDEDNAPEGDSKAANDAPRSGLSLAQITPISIGGGLDSRSKNRGNTNAKRDHHGVAAIASENETDETAELDEEEDQMVNGPSLDDERLQISRIPLPAT